MEDTEDRKGEPLTPEEIERFKGVLERVGKREARGFLYIAEVQKDNEKDKYTDADGLLFTNHVSKSAMLISLFNELEMDRSSVIALTFLMDKKKHLWEQWIG